MERTPSPPESPVSPQGTFAGLRAEIESGKETIATGGSSLPRFDPAWLSSLPRFNPALLSSLPRYDLALLLWYRINPTSGEFWLVEIEGKEPFPGVICDESLVYSRSFLNQRNPPFSAKRGHGNWSVEYWPDKDLDGVRTFPVLFLNKLEFDWIPRKRLLCQLDQDAAVAKMMEINDMRDGIARDELKAAYKDVWRGYDLDYWKSVILARRLAHEDVQHGSRNDEIPSKSIRGQKRKCEDGRSGYPHAIEDDECEDEDESHLFTKIKQKQPSSDPPLDLPAGEMDGPLAKRQRKSMSTKEGTLFTTTMVPPQKISDNHVRIYVGNPYTAFIVSKAGFKQSDFLQSLIKYEKGEAYIMSPLLSNINPSLFRKVADYMNTGEYYPVLLNETTARAWLEDTDTRGRRTATMEEFGDIYKLGEDLQLPGLQDLVIRKFRVLAPQADCDDFLAAARSFYSRGRPSDVNLHEFVVAHFAQEHNEFLEHQLESYVEFCEEHRELEMKIQRKRSANRDEEVA